MILGLWCVAVGCCFAYLCVDEVSATHSVFVFLSAASFLLLYLRHILFAAKVPVFQAHMFLARQFDKASADEMRKTMLLDCVIPLLWLSCRSRAAGNIGESQLEKCACKTKLLSAVKTIKLLSQKETHSPNFDVFQSISLCQH